jgi:hypothetical protein
MSNDKIFEMKSPCFIECSGFSDAEVIMLPLNYTVDTIASFIKKKFAGIGGIFNDSVYFMGYGENIDHSMYITHEINHNKLVKQFYGDATISLATMEEKLKSFANSFGKFTETSPEKFIKDTREKYKKVEPLGEPSTGFYTICCVPLEIQIKACAIVAGLTYDEMLDRMKIIS